MIYRNAIILVTLAVSSNAFWWGSERDIEPQPTVKQVPVGYFRTFTYHPLPFNPQTANQYFSYPGGKMLQPSSLYSWPKQLPIQPGSQSYGQNPSHNLHPSPNTQNVPSPIAPTNTVPIQTTQSLQPPHLSSSQPATYSANSNPATLTPTTQSQSLINEVQTPTTGPAQFSSNSQHPIRHMSSFVPDPINLQYVTNVAPLPLQHVQFVPCMCPVALNIAPDVIANKRSDEIPIPADYRETPTGDQPNGLSDER